MQTEEHKIIEAFGKRVRTLREARDWSQSDLSHEAELDVGYIGKVERGRVNPGLVYITILARAFNITVSELMDY